MIFLVGLFVVAMQVYFGSSPLHGVCMVRPFTNFYSAGTESEDKLMGSILNTIVGTNNSTADLGWIH